MRLKIRDDASPDYVQGFKDCEAYYKTRMESIANKYKGVVMRLATPHVVQKRYGAIAARHADEGLLKINAYLIQASAHALDPDELYSILDSEERAIVDSIVDGIIAE